MGYDSFGFGFVCGAVCMLVVALVMLRLLLPPKDASP